MASITEKIFNKPINEVSKHDLDLIIDEEESLELEFKQIKHFHRNGCKILEEEKKEKNN